MEKVASYTVGEKQIHLEELQRDVDSSPQSSDLRSTNKELFKLGLQVGSL